MRRADDQRVARDAALLQTSARHRVCLSVRTKFAVGGIAVLPGMMNAFLVTGLRTLLRARTIWGALPEQGLSVQARWRQYSSGDSDVPDAYFNPDRYRTWDGVLSLRRRVGTWRVAGLAGGGQERIENGSWQSTGVAEVRAEGPVGRDMHLVCSANYSNAAGFANSPNYWYGAVNVSLIVPLGR